MKNHGWRLPPLGANVPASHTLRTSSGGTGSGFRRRIARVVRMPSSSGTSSPAARTSLIAGLAGVLFDADHRGSFAARIRPDEDHASDLLVVEARDLRLGA